MSKSSFHLLNDQYVDMSIPQPVYTLISAPNLMSLNRAALVKWTCCKVKWLEIAVFSIFSTIHYLTIQHKQRSVEHERALYVRLVGARWNMLITKHFTRRSCDSTPSS